MDLNRLAYLAKKYFENNSTDEEQQELATLVQKAKQDVQLKRVLEGVWNKYEPEQQMPDDMSNRILHNLFTNSGTTVEAPSLTTTHEINTAFSGDDHAEVVAHHIPVWKYISIAASFVLVFTLTWWLTKKEVVKDDPSPHVVSTQKGSRSKLELPDGTLVWLNAGSMLQYDNDFGRSVRKISLTGEAFFDVAHNKEKPFIIHTTAMDLRVLGTTFNVRAYPEEKETEAALITGVLEVSFANQPSKTVVLKPAEKISVSNEKNETDSVQVISPATKPSPAVSSVTYQPGDSSVIETSWVNNKLVFRNKPFEEVAMELSRWYNVNFEIHDKTLLTKRFTGTFETETIYEALARLSDSYSFLFTYDKTRKLFIIDK